MPVKVAIGDADVSKARPTPAQPPAATDDRNVLEALADGLNPRVGDGLVARIGPMVALAAWLLLLAVLLFDLVPVGNRDLAWTIWGTLGTATGVYGRHSGRL